VLANPHGLRIVAWPLSYALDWSSVWRRTAEWRSPLVPGPLVSPLFPVAIAALLWATLKLTLRRDWPGVGALPLAALLLAQLTLAMALASRRIIPLFAITAAPVTALALGRVRPPRRLAPAAGSRFAAYGAPLLMLGIAVLRLHPQPVATAPAFASLTESSFFPADAVNALMAHAEGGRVFNLYNWGGYLQWRSDGRFKVFIDGRADAVYTPETLRIYLDFAEGRDWKTVLDASGARFFLWRADLPHPQALLAIGGWRALHQDRLAVLLERTGD
jgi:hypothetical protein